MAAQLKLAPPALPRVVEVTEFACDGLAPRIKSGESLLVERDVTAPLEKGEEVIYITEGYVRGVAIWQGRRNGRDLLERLDGTPLAVRPVVMRRIVAVIRRPHSDRPRL